MRTNEFFYSNCLFEALKAKIKDPKNIKIHFIPLSLNKESVHFYWYDIKDQSVKQFTHKANECINYIFFKGEIGSYNINLFEGRLFSKMKGLGWSDEKQRAYAIKKGFFNQEPFSIKVSKGH